MSEQEREEFLKEANVAVLATVGGGGAGPCGADLVSV